MNKICLFLLTAILSIGLISCIEAMPVIAFVPSATNIPKEEITVAAASDLQFAFSEIAEKFEDETGIKVNLVFGSSGILTQQISQGAPYDLFASADYAYIEKLTVENLTIPESVAVFAQGRIVLATNDVSGVQVQRLSDLLSPQVQHISIANPAHAPYGAAAMQALKAAGIWDQVQSKLVFGENVRQAMQYIQSGDSEAGIVALSIVNAPGVSWTPIDESLYLPLFQTLTVLSRSANIPLANRFAEYVIGENGRFALHRFGFVLPGDELFSGEMPAP